MICPAKYCGMKLVTEAEVFLHQQLHAEPWEGYAQGTRTLNGLSPILMPRIARLMEDYHQHRLRQTFGQAPAPLVPLQDFDPDL